MSAHDPSHPDEAPPAPRTKPLAEVRYSLPEMLAELETEKGSATFAMEKLDQSEIGKLFKSKKPTRVKPKS